MQQKYFNKNVWGCTESGMEKLSHTKVKQHISETLNIPVHLYNYMSPLVLSQDTSCVTGSGETVTLRLNKVEVMTGAVESTWNVEGPPCQRCLSLWRLMAVTLGLSWPPMYLYQFALPHADLGTFCIAAKISLKVLDKLWVSWRFWEVKSVFGTSLVKHCILDTLVNIFLPKTSHVVASN